MSNRVGPRQLREMAQARIGEVLGALFPGQAITYPVFTPLNPTRDDKTPGSFVIWTRGAACGGFIEYAREGEKGDVIDLVAYVHRRDRAFALRWLEDLFGIRDMDPALLRQAKATARTKACETQKADSAKLARKRRIANDMFRRAEPSILGTVAEDYLAARGIAYRALKFPEQDVRFAPSLEWWKGAKWKTEEGGVKTKVEPGPKFPAIVAAMRNIHGELTAVHCTFLRADGTGKADVAGAKLMYGQVKGAIIRLTRGPSNLTWEEAKANGVLEPFAVGEGLETMLTVGLAIPECVTGAAGSLDNIANVYVTHDRVEETYVCFDNDAGPKLAEKRNTIMDVLGASGNPVAAMMPPDGINDWNEA